MSDTASAAPRVPKRVAAVILNSLKGGVVPRIGLPYITVGREVEIRALLTDLSLIADGGASFRFLVGRYGAGKSFLLQTIRTHAMGEGFVVADADLSPERRLQGGQHLLAAHAAVDQQRAAFGAQHGGVSTGTAEKGAEGNQNKGSFGKGDGKHCIIFFL